jgi:tellurite methyltransferase
MADERLLDPPSLFVAQWIRDLGARMPARRRGLDVAMGRGRHTRLMAEAGFKTFGIDLSFDAVCSVRTDAQRHGLPVHGWCADLTQHPLPADRFELVVVTRYLQRDLFGPLMSTLTHGGVLVYETFTEAQLQHGRGPRSPDHLLASGELRSRCEGLDVLFYEETTEPDAVARLVGQKI